MSKATLLIGGNLGDRVAIFESARETIAKEVGPILKISSLYESESWGFIADKIFLNQAIQVETNLTPHELLVRLKEIEKGHGREVNNAEGYSSRLLDVDILFYNDEELEDKDLIIPHPRLHKRKFALLPLREVMCNYIHPKLNKTVNAMLNECDDQSEVKQYGIIENSVAI